MKDKHSYCYYTPMSYCIPYISVFVIICLSAIAPAKAQHRERNLTEIPIKPPVTNIANIGESTIFVLTLGDSYTTWYNHSFLHFIERAKDNVDSPWTEIQVFNSLRFDDDAVVSITLWPLADCIYKSAYIYKLDSPSIAPKIVLVTSERSSSNNADIISQSSPTEQLITLYELHIQNESYPLVDRPQAYFLKRNSEKTRGVACTQDEIRTFISPIIKRVYPFDQAGLLKARKAARP